MYVVTEGAWDIPDLEALLRHVIRRSMESESGSAWLSSLPSNVVKHVSDVAALARRKRPHEQLRDDWDAAGMPAIRALVAWKLPQALTSVWIDPRFALVDLERLTTTRDKRAHRVGPPIGEIEGSEAAAIVTRLRLGLEDVRRRLDDQQGDWWPYIASVHSNLEALCWERASGWKGGNDVVTEGDLLTFDVVGVNPTGAEADLRYDYRLIQSGGAQQSIAWDERRSACLEVPLCKTILFKLSVGTAYDIGNVDAIKRQLRVRPCQ